MNHAVAWFNMVQQHGRLNNGSPQSLCLHVYDLTLLATMRSHSDDFQLHRPLLTTKLLYPILSFSPSCDLLFGMLSSTSWIPYLTQVIDHPLLTLSKLELVLDLFSPNIKFLISFPPRIISGNLCKKYEINYSKSVPK